MIQIRHNIFETNSSSTHSLVIMTNDEWKKVENGELFIDVFAAEHGKTELVDEEKLYKEAKEEYQESDDKYGRNYESWDDKIARLKVNYPKALETKDIIIFGFAGERFINTKSGVWHSHEVKQIDKDHVQVEFDHFFG